MIQYPIRLLHSCRLGNRYITHCCGVAWYLPMRVCMNMCTQTSFCMCLHRFQRSLNFDDSRKSQNIHRNWWCAGSKNRHFYYTQLMDVTDKNNVVSYPSDDIKGGVSQSSWIYQSVDDTGVKIATINMSSFRSSMKLHCAFPINSKCCRDSCLTAH